MALGVWNVLSSLGWRKAERGEGRVRKGAGRNNAEVVPEETVPCPFPNDSLSVSSGRARWPVPGGSQPVKNQEAERCGWGIWLMLEPPYMCWSWLV